MGSSSVVGYREQSVLCTARRQTRPRNKWRPTVTAPAPLPITLEHVLLQIGVVEKQDVIVVDNKREPEAEQSASIAKIDENGEPNF